MIFSLRAGATEPRASARRRSGSRSARCRSQRFTASSRDALGTNVRAADADPHRRGVGRQPAPRDRDRARARAPAACRTRSHRCRCRTASARSSARACARCPRRRATRCSAWPRSHGRTPRSSTTTALAAAEESGLVSIDPSGRVRFTHPLFASAVYAAAATTRRRAVHARPCGSRRRSDRARASPRARKRRPRSGRRAPSSSRRRGTRARAARRTRPRACSSSRCASCRPRTRSRSGCSSSSRSTCTSRATSRAHAPCSRSCSRRSHPATAARAR